MTFFRIALVGLFLFPLASPGTAQSPKRFRGGIFLHHSTGMNIWGPNGSSTSFPSEVAIYNSQHGYVDTDLVSLGEQWWPNGYLDSDNEWATWHQIFSNQTPGVEIGPILENNRIVVIKSCFPSSHMVPGGEPADTLTPASKSVYNFKWHWRSIVRVMREHPENFFVMWTNAPEMAVIIDPWQAEAAHLACRWAKDTLAMGLDPEFGEFPDNVYVFDFFHKLADSTFSLPVEYAVGWNDAHPNAAATALVVPEFVKEVFDAALAYEATLTGVGETSLPSEFSLGQNYPNPFNPTTTIEYQLPKRADVRLEVVDVVGHVVAILADGLEGPGYKSVRFDAADLASGVYFSRLRAGEFTQVRKLLLLR